MANITTRFPEEVMKTAQSDGAKLDAALAAAVATDVVQKFNPNHDERGRFAESEGGGGESSSDSASREQRTRADSWGESSEHKQIQEVLGRHGLEHEKSSSDGDVTTHEFKGKTDYYGRPLRVSLRQSKTGYTVRISRGTRGTTTPKMREANNSHVKDYENLGMGHADAGKISHLLGTLLKR